MADFKKNIISISFLFFVLSFFSPLLWRGAGGEAFSQEGTRTTKTNPADATRKIMIVPFDPKLYMSDVDMKINQQTKWKFPQIRENFRQQLNAQLKLKLQSISPVVSFYSDSAKMAKDLSYIYKSTDLSYDLIPNPTDVKTPLVHKNGIKNGQLAVEISTDKKFMNAKVGDEKLLSYLSTKYKTDYYVFINQLDIKNNMDTYDIGTDIFQREIAVHYSILDKTGKNIAAGIASSSFSSKENDPKKIVSQNFGPIAAYIAAKLNLAIKPELKPAPKK
ncbi:MAG: hypothetical protein V4549_17505 [Bacteroidota bacterium]